MVSLCVVCGTRRKVVERSLGWCQVCSVDWTVSDYCHHGPSTYHPSTAQIRPPRLPSSPTSRKPQWSVCCWSDVLTRGVPSQTPLWLMSSTPGISLTSPVTWSPDWRPTASPSPSSLHLGPPGRIWLGLWRAWWKRRLRSLNTIVVAISYPFIMPFLTLLDNINLGTIGDHS